MDENPFFFTGGDYELFGVLHRPPGEMKDEGFVFCHPILEEKLWAHRAYVSFARDLAARGYPVLRFDHRGQGDSDGNFSETSVDSHLSDIDAAVTRLRLDLPGLTKISLFGLRLGATFAALAALRSNDIYRLLLWEPIVNGERYMQEVLRINLTAQMATNGRVIDDRKKLTEYLRNGLTVNIEGYELGQSLFTQVSAIDLLKKPGIKGKKNLILQVTRKMQSPREEIAALSNHYEAQAAVVQEDPFWREIKPFYQRAGELSDVSLRWLNGENVVVESVHG